MALIDEVSARWQSGGLVKIEVPEWGSEESPFVGYFKPWTLDDERGVRHFIGDENPEGFAAVVCKKLTDSDGKSLFDTGDRKRLMRNCESHILKRIAGTILGATVSTEDAAGN